MKIRRAAISPSADCLRSSMARRVSLPTSRMVVMPQASQMLSSYPMGCGLPPRETETASSGTTSAMRLFSMRMSLGPLAGVPLPIDHGRVVDEEAADALAVGGGGLRERGRGEGQEE